MYDIKPLLKASAARHNHLCPRQVLGVRVALAGAEALGVEIPRADKRLLVILETDGCFADGVEAASGATAGHRTMRIEDYGKIAATFIDTLTGEAVRVRPRLDVRHEAVIYAPEEMERYQAMLYAYERMPVEELLEVEHVNLAVTVDKIISRPELRAQCSVCGEEIFNGREVECEGQIFCRSCTGDAYYRLAGKN